MKLVFRKILRWVLKGLCIYTINKNGLEIIAVGGWNGTDVVREAIYNILKSNGQKVRRTIHTPKVDWDIPLTILGINMLPSNAFEWVYQVFRTIIRNLISSQKSKLIVLQINSHDAGIMKYWMSFLDPDCVIILNSHAGTLNLELLLVEKLKKNGYLVLNNDNIRTKSLARGREDRVIYYGKQSSDQNLDYSYIENNQSTLDLIHADNRFALTKVFPQHIYSLLCASLCICDVYNIDFDLAVKELDSFKPPSDKMSDLFYKYVEE